MSEPVWLERQIVLLLHRQALAEHRGLAGVREHGLLESALARPQNRFAYEGETDLCALAAAHAAGIARNHPFADGNKLTAFVAAFTFLLANGVELIVPDGEAIAAMLDLAAGELPEAGLAAWLRDKLRPPTTPA